jgi:uncharacterized protein YjlB
MAKGDAVVVPAGIENFEVRPQWTLEFIRAYVPGEQLPEPRITMPSLQSNSLNL